MRAIDRIKRKQEPLTEVQLILQKQDFRKLFENMYPDIKREKNYLADMEWTEKNEKPE